MKKTTKNVNEMCLAFLMEEGDSVQMQGWGKEKLAPVQLRRIIT